MNAARDKARIRLSIWRRLEEEDLALFPRPVYGRIPNFKGSREAGERIRLLRVYRDAGAVKANPDAPQRIVRYNVLKDGKILVMPTPRIRRGFILLDPSKIDRRLYWEASTIKGAFKHGEIVALEELSNRLEAVDFIVEGSVAVDVHGGRLGKGEGYGDKEFSMLRRTGLADECTPIATTVHDIQLVGFTLPQEDHDVRVGAISTPSRLLITDHGRRQEERCGFKYI